MVRRIVMGIVWFFIFQWFLGFIAGISIGALTEQQLMQASSKFTPVILIVSLVLAILGTAMGKLPGTRKPTQAEIEKRQMQEGMKKCSYCAEMIKSDAKVCRYCRREVQ